MEMQKNNEFQAPSGVGYEQGYSQPNFAPESYNSANGFEQVSTFESNLPTVDRFQQNFEQNSVQMPQVQATPILPPVQDQISDSNLEVVHTPERAQDTDLMEDEWVKDFKKMISETKNDPHERQSRFVEMQVDYLKKRFGRVINGGK